MDRIEEIKAVQDIQKLDDSGFWTEAQKVIDALLKGFRLDLEAEGNPHERDLLIKGKILGVKMVQTKLDTLIKQLKAKIGQ